MIQNFDALHAETIWQVFYFNFNIFPSYSQNATQTLLIGLERLGEEVELILVAMCYFKG